MIICYILYATGFWGLDFHNTYVIANSVSQCEDYTATLNNGHLIGTFPPLDYSSPQQLCGNDLKDCKDIRK